jgi:hypothetical protein
VYEVLTAGLVSGIFDDVIFTNPPVKLEWQVLYAANSVTIQAIAVVPGDCDDDGDVDLDDFTNFTACLLGPDAGLDPGCACFDFDGDGDIDLLDFAGFQVDFFGD